MVLDEISGPAGATDHHPCGHLVADHRLLKKTEQSQRVLDEASEGLTFDVISAEDNPDENNLDREAHVGRRHQPIIRLVDTTIFTALERGLPTFTWKPMTIRWW